MRSTRLSWVPLLAALVLAAAPLAAQATGTVRGKITAANTMRPLAGAQVALPGIGRGSLTNAAGEFLIVNVPAGQHALRVQMIGFTSQERSITVAEGQTAQVDVQLSESAIALDEVVVTGTAGQARRREVGNSISQIRIDDVRDPVKDVDALLQGRAAGVNVSASSGSIGAGSSIRLRGNTSVALSNQPLIYIDGVRVRGDAYPKNVPATGFQGRSANVTSSPLNDISPNDIERVEVIKGAAATTLYGTEAAAGVIQIFTKRGIQGGASWTAQVDQGISRMRPFAPDLATPTPMEYGQAKYLFIDPWLRDGHRQKYALSVTGGGQALQYFVSGTYDDNEGVLPLDEQQKYNLRGNFSFSPIEKLNLQWNTSYTKDNLQQTPAGNNAHGLTLNAFRRERNYFASYDKNLIDKALDYEINTYIDRLIVGGTAVWTPMENFSHRFTVGFDQANIENRQVRPFGFFAEPAGVVSDQRWSAETLTFDYVGSYERGITPDLRGTFSFGAQSATVDEADVTGYSTNFPGVPVPVVTSGSSQLAFENRQRVINAGLFGQAMVGFKDRYFLTAGLRVDGNSAFGQDFGLAPYPKVSASYVVSEEPFWNEAWGTLKLRAAYGTAGRAPGAFDAVRTWNAVGWGGQPAFRPNNEGNPLLGPEVTAETELGFDAAFLNNRLGLDFTYYYARTTDALFRVRLVPSEGFYSDVVGSTGFQLRNVGEMENKGVEVALSAALVQRPSFSWDAGLTVATNHSKVLSLGGAPAFNLGTHGWIVEGQPVPVVRARRIMNPDQATSKRDDVIIAPLDSDDAFYGPNQPTLTLGGHTSFDLPYGIQLSARGEYMGGHYIYDGASFNALERAVEWPSCFDAYAKIRENRQDQLTAKERMQCIQGNVLADWFIQDATFFKLRDVTLRVPLNAVMRNTRNATLSLSAANWFAWRKDFPVFDPEVNGNDGFNSTVRSVTEHIPAPATLTASVRVVF